MDVRHSSWRRHDSVMLFPVILRSVIDSLCPRLCPLCNAPAKVLLCDQCEKHLPINSSYKCKQCDLPLMVESQYCSECIETPPSYTTTFCAFRYGFPIDTLVHKLKNDRKHAIACALANYLAAHVRAEEADVPDLLCPLPMHWRRRLSRGFNQTELIASTLSKALDIPTVCALKKIRSTDAQKSLSRNKRLRNLSKSMAASEDVHGKFIVLVDDIITTGASVEAAARELLNAGAWRVDIWAIARTPKS